MISQIRNCWPFFKQAASHTSKYLIFLSNQHFPVNFPLGINRPFFSLKKRYSGSQTRSPDVPYAQNLVKKYSDDKTNYCSWLRIRGFRTSVISEADNAKEPKLLATWSYGVLTRMFYEERSFSWYFFFEFRGHSVFFAGRGPAENYSSTSVKSVSWDVCWKNVEERILKEYDVWLLNCSNRSRCTSLNQLLRRLTVCVRMFYVSMLLKIIGMIKIKFVHRQNEKRHLYCLYSLIKSY